MGRRLWRRLSEWTRKLTTKRWWWHLGHALDALFSVAMVLFFAGMLQTALSALKNGALSVPPMATLVPGSAWGIAIIFVTSLLTGVTRLIDSVELQDLDASGLTEEEQRRRPSERARANLASFAAIEMTLLTNSWLQNMMSGQSFDTRGQDPFLNWMVYGVGVMFLVASLACVAISTGARERGSVPVLERALYLLSALTTFSLGLLFTLWAWLTSWGGALSFTGVIADVSVAAGGNGLFMVLVPAVAGIVTSGLGIAQAGIRWSNPPVTGLEPVQPISDEGAAGD